VSVLCYRRSFFEKQIYLLLLQLSYSDVCELLELHPFGFRVFLVMSLRDLIRSSQEDNFIIYDPDEEKAADER
jgi:hypothetical protein